MINLFVKGVPNNVVVYAVSGGSGVTGLTDASFTVYASVEGGVPASVTITGLVTELDNTNMPGLYNIAMPAGSFAAYGNVTFYISGALFDPIVVQGNVGIADYILDTRAMAGQVGTSITSPVYDGSGNMTSGTIKGFNPNSNPDSDPARVTGTITATYNADGTMATFKVTEV